MARVCRTAWERSENCKWVCRVKLVKRTSAREGILPPRGQHLHWVFRGRISAGRLSSHNLDDFFVKIPRTLERQIWLILKLVLGAECLFVFQFFYSRIHLPTSAIHYLFLPFVPPCDAHITSRSQSFFTPLFLFSSVFLNSLYWNRQ